MGLICKLARRDLLRHGWRSVFSVLAIAAAVAVVIWTQGAFFTRAAQTDFFARNILGKYALWITPASGDQFAPNRQAMMAQSRGRPTLPPALTEQQLLQMRSAPEVAQVLPMSTSMVRMRPVSEKMLRMPGGTLAAVDWPVPPELGGTFAGKWLQPESAAAEVVVVKQSEGAAARGPWRVDLTLGNELFIVTANGETRVKIIGVIEMATASDRIPKIFTTPALAAKISGVNKDNAQDAPVASAMKAAGATSHNSAFIALKPGSDERTVREKWLSSMFPEPTRLTVNGAKELAALIAQGSGKGGGATMMDLSGYYMVLVTLLASIFIIFTTLNMGICERLRQLSMLRAVGMTRVQAAWNVFINGLGLGAGGMIVGIVAGWLALQIMVFFHPEQYPNGVAISWISLLIAFLCSMGGAVMGSIFPVWSVMRLQPLATLNPVSTLHRRKLPWRMGLVGLLLLAPAYVIAYLGYFPFAGELTALARQILFFAVGVPLVGIGCILLMPVLIATVERIFSGVLARMLGLEPKLLALTLTGKLWQSAGVAICLSIGLGLFVGIQTWGYSMLKPFQPTSDLADAVFCFTPTGVPPELFKEVYQTPGIEGNRCLPVQFRQLQVGPETRKALEANREMDLTSDNLLMAGVDPEKAYAGDDPVFKFTFIQGTKEDAIAKLKKGGYCLIQQDFYNHARLGVGDKISVILPAARGAGRGPQGEGRRGQGRGGAVAGAVPPGATEKEFEIAGVVQMPWILFTGWTPIRGQDGAPRATLALTFVNYTDGRALTNSDHALFFWSNLTAEFMQVPAKQRQEKLDEELSKVADKIPETTRFDRSTMQMVAVPRQSIFIDFEDNMINLATRHAGDIIWKMCEMPGWALAITLLAVVNMLMSAIRTRAWEFGVLRSVGLTGGQLMRMLLAEAVLVALVAVGLSLFGGVYIAACIATLAKYSYMFTGLPIELVLPWGHLLPGLAAAVFLTVLAALIPGWLLGRQRPSLLLQQGRQTM